MGVFDVVLTGLALSMDACAVSMTNGMTNSKMPFRRVLLIGLFFGFFQFLMPVIGYFVTHLVAGAFQEIFEKIASWVAFVLLAFLGGKMILDCILDYRKDKAKEQDKDNACVCGDSPEKACENLSIVKLFTQAIATSIDALAIGITFRATAVNGGLSLGVWLSAGLIGVITLLLAVGAVYIGKAVGNRLADKATLCGGVVLVILAIKMLFI